MTTKFETLVNKEDNYDLINIPKFLYAIKLFFFGKSKNTKKDKKLTQTHGKNVEFLSKEDSLLYLKNFITSITLLNNCLKNYTMLSKKSSSNKNKGNTFTELDVYTKLILNTVSFISSYFEEFMMLQLNNENISSYNYFSEIILKNKVQLIIIKLIVIFPMKHQCVLPCKMIINRIICVKKEQKEPIANFIKSKEIISGFRTVFLNLYNNSKFFNII